MDTKRDNTGKDLQRWLQGFIPLSPPGTDELIKEINEFCDKYEKNNNTVDKKY